MGTKLMLQKATATSKLEISILRKKVYQKMLADGINQWDEDYPSESILFDDIDQGNMYLCLVDDGIAAYVSADENIPEEYETVSFHYEKPSICVHRLSVNPDYLRMGIATELMHYIQEEARKLGYKSVVLDTYEGNEGALALYNKLGYEKRGHVKFPRRPDFRFVVMEKALY